MTAADMSRVDVPGFDAWITQQQNLNTAARRTR